MEKSKPMKMQKKELKAVAMAIINHYDNARQEILGVFRKQAQVEESIPIGGVSMIKLMDLRSSRLLNSHGDDVSGGGASLTLEEVIRDLSSLNWQECHVTSLLTQVASDSDSPTNKAVKLKSGPKKGKSRSIGAIEGGSSFAFTGIAKKPRTATEMLIDPKPKSGPKTGISRPIAVIEAGSSVAFTGVAKKPRTATEMLIDPKDVLMNAKYAFLLPYNAVLVFPDMIIYSLVSCNGNMAKKEAAKGGKKCRFVPALSKYAPSWDDDEPNSFYGPPKKGVDGRLNYEGWFWFTGHQELMRFNSHVSLTPVHPPRLYCN